VRRLDHLIVVAPSLDSGVSALVAQLGVRASEGGRHEGRGTRNALLSLGDDRYLEILAPDPEQSVPAGRRWLGIGDRTSMRLATWVAKASNLDEVAQRARTAGVDLGEPRSGSRQRPDGTLLSWHTLGADQSRLDGLIPFFIDWGTTPHPSAVVAAGAALRALRGVHPDATRVREVIQALDLDLEVEPGSEPGLIATIECPRGVVELR